MGKRETYNLMSIYRQLTKIMSWVTNYFWREISAFMYNFTCEITKLPWKRLARMFSIQKSEKTLLHA